MFFSRLIRTSKKRDLIDHTEREALRRRLGSQISARSNESDVLDYVTAELAHLLLADAVTWEPLPESGEPSLSSVAVPTLAAPKYQLRAHGIYKGSSTGRSLPADVVEIMEYAAKLLSRQLDFIRAGELQSYAEEYTRGTQLLFVTLGYELGKVQEQIAEMQQYISKPLHIGIDVASELLDIKIPPYLLQPIVDNAVRHGIALQSNGGRIMISATVCDGEMTISVSDTGDGFVPSKNENTTSLSQLRNVLAEYYGCEAEMRIDSIAAYGTTVSITLPYTSEHHAQLWP